MERLNKIFAEWAKDDKKTKLASEKINLSILSDLKSLDDVSLRASMDLDESVSQAIKIIERAKKQSPIASEKVNLYLSLASKAKKMAEELGIDYPYENELKKVKAVYGLAIKKYNKFVK